MAPGSGSNDLPFAKRFGLIAASSLAAEAITFPIDFAKTRMQLTVGKQSFFRALFTAVRQEGLGSVYAALPPAVMRHWIYSTLRIGLYEDLRLYFAGGKDKEISHVNAAMCGLLAGGFAQAVASPADRIKVLIVSSTKRQSPIAVAKQVFAKEGVRGFYVGVGPNVLRACCVNLGELFMYDKSKRFILESTGRPDDIITHTLAAVSSGLGASAMSTPADVLKSRVMGGQSDGVLACIRTTLKTEGPRAFTKGFLPNWARLGPWQFFFWVTYEKLRVVSGHEGFK